MTYQEVIETMLADEASTDVWSAYCLNMSKELENAVSSYRAVKETYKTVLAELVKQKDLRKETAKDFETAFRLVRLENDQLRQRVRDLEEALRG